MLQFNELRLTADNKCLIIDVQVEDLSYFENVKIDSIFIDTQDTWISNGPSDNATRVYSQNAGTALDILGDSTGKHVRIEATSPIITPAKNNMYFVYVIADVSNAPEALEAPCNCSNETIIGTVINLYTLYNTLMGNIKELGNTCETPVNLINAFLRQQMIDACIKTGNYALAIKYWKAFFLGTEKMYISKSCGCNGGT
jgi:hypothetical protein